MCSSIYLAFIFTMYIEYWRIFVTRSRVCFQLRIVLSLDWGTMVDGADRTDRTDGADENRGIDEKQCA